MKNLVSVLILTLSVALLTACGEEKQKVSWETQEDARATAKANAKFNIQEYRKENAQWHGYIINVMGDSTISDTCARGDGWASVKLLHPQTRKPYEFKCSTVSASIGCLEQAVFDSRDFASEDKHCQEKLPFPLPKLK